MPQINGYTYLTQCSWLLIIFITYYMTLKQYLLPNLLEKIYIKLLLSRPEAEGLINRNTKSLDTEGYTF